MLLERMNRDPALGSSVLLTFTTDSMGFFIFWASRRCCSPERGRAGARTRDGQDFSTMEDSNRSSNPDFHRVSDPSRRTLVRGGLGAVVGGVLAPLAGCASTGTASGTASGPAMSFAPVPAGTADAVVVPDGYVAQPICAWGEPVGIAGNLPAWKPDATNSAAEQRVQVGMHHDGIHYFALDGGRRGVLALNNEYADDGLLHPDGMADWSAEKTARSIAAHGVTIVEVERRGDGSWDMVRPSPYARRITAATPIALSGPAAGHPLLRTADDPGGHARARHAEQLRGRPHALGHVLTAEENFVLYFDGPDRPDAHQRRWGMRRGGLGYRWHEHEPRFDAGRHPNEFNRFGWIVEIDPWTRPRRRSSAPRSGAPRTRVRPSRC
jgi:secreted PhoX family phosphatase